MRTVTLIGGIASGREVRVLGSETIMVPELVPAKRMPTNDDAFYLHPDGSFKEWVDPDLNPTFIRHAYSGRTGEYVGVQ